MSKEKLLSVFSESESAKSLIFKIKKIRKDLKKSRHEFSKSEIKEIRKNLYRLESKKKSLNKKIKEIEKSLTRLKKYYDYDAAEYIGIRYIENLLNQPNDKGYYKPIKTKSTFNGNYTEYENNGDKDKNLSAKEHLNVIRRYLSNIINNNKTPKNLNVQFK